MADTTSEFRHRLSGEWTISEIDSQFESLNGILQQLSSSQQNILHVDCSTIGSMDMSGLQLLYVWMECAKMQGIGVRLVNQPHGMRQTIRKLGFEHCFPVSSPDATGAPGQLNSDGPPPEAPNGC